MRNRYRIYVLGEAPADLKERISEIHADAVLQSRGNDESTRDRKNKTGKAARDDCIRG